MVRPRLPAPACAAIAALCVFAAPAAGMESILQRFPANAGADSLAPLLQRIESGSARPTAGAAAFALGELYEARGDVRLAADAFGRAAARLTADDRARARYRQGVAWLGVPDVWRARAAFEESQRSPAMRAESQF